MVTPEPAAPRARLALTSHLLLVALTLLWEGGFAAKGPPGFWLAVKLLPLLPPLPGLLRGRLRSYVIASLIMLPYLTEGLVLTWTERTLGLARGSAWPWALGEVVLALTFLGSAAMYVRRRRAEGASLER